MTFTDVVVLSGGVGGARFLDGLAQVLPAEVLTCVVNTGDDFTHLGLTICPDLDTCMYTLAGLADEVRGWGLRDETFAALGMVGRLGGPGWFQLGDRDLGTHLVRTQLLAEGQSLTAVTARLCTALGVGPRLLPMADRPRSTLIETVDEGTLPFQEWFVRRRAQPAVRAVRFEGPPQPAPEVLAALERCQLVLIGPSNPYVSIDPILALDGVAAAVAKRPVVAVSPIVAGQAVKGPLASMIPQLTGTPATAAAIARHYGPLLRGLVVERGDEPAVAGVAVLGTDTIMRGRPERRCLAEEVLAFAAELVR